MAPGTRVWLACQPVSMRKGFDGLAAEAARMIGVDPYSGAVFLFRSKRGDYLKALYWDGSGLCLYAKRLEEGRFAWPAIVDARLRLSPAQLQLLIEGVDWRRTVAIEAPLTPAHV
ncbi:MAG TPA: IS66 family insertion sequence element accessory protein TnpB [Caulobacteraceae bacterium]|nr:IS66 family insertion sequence element accessory protein TnpB [Caulobacteraceae bacterium]